MEAQPQETQERGFTNLLKILVLQEFKDPFPLPAFPSGKFSVYVTHTDPVLQPEISDSSHKPFKRFRCLRQFKTHVENQLPKPVASQNITENNFSATTTVLWNDSACFLNLIWLKWLGWGTLFLHLITKCTFLCFSIFTVWLIFCHWQVRQATYLKEAISRHGFIKSYVNTKC